MGRVRTVALIAAAFFVALLVMYGFDFQARKAQQGLSDFRRTGDGFLVKLARLSHAALVLKNYPGARCASCVRRA